jgi:hypothetical protein
MSPIWKWPKRKKTADSTTTQRTFTGTTSDSGKVHATLTRSNGSMTLIVLCPDGFSFTFPSEHPNFVQARALAFPDDGSAAEKESEKYRKLFDVEESVRDLFGVITDRVRVAEGIVYFDDKPMHNAVTEQILRFMEEGIKDYKPLAKFMENIADNPNENSRNQLFDWLELHHLAIDENGHVVCFKGVSRDYKPSRSGPGSVIYPNGRVVKVDHGMLDYSPGNQVTIDRALCDENPNNTCSVGLHVANRRFADNHQGHTVEVRVNPKDFVSVTADSSREKIRCCRLFVVGDAPPASHYNSALILGK